MCHAEQHDAYEQTLYELWYTHGQPFVLMQIIYLRAQYHIRLRPYSTTPWSESARAIARRTHLERMALT